MFFSNFYNNLFSSLQLQRFQFVHVDDINHCVAAKPKERNANSESDEMGPENIPHLNEANFMSMDAIDGHQHLLHHQHHRYNHHRKTYDMEMTNMASDEDPHQRLSISSWSQDNEDGTDGGDDSGTMLDDNMSQVGSDYSEFPANDMIGPHPMSSDEYAEDIKYHPSEMMLRPTSSSAIQFNYNFPPLNSLTPHHPAMQRLHPAPHTQPPVEHQHMQPEHQPPHQHIHHPPMQQQMFRDPREMCTSPSADYNPNSHPSQNYFHSNMWYPNAPIGSYRSYGSHPYGRQFGPKFSHDHMMDMFQLSNR